MSSWIVVRRSPGGNWIVNPQILDDHEAQTYAWRLPVRLEVVGLNLDSLPPLPVLTPDEAALGGEA